jgi:hypothetical protein
MGLKLCEEPLLSKITDSPVNPPFRGRCSALPWGVHPGASIGIALHWSEARKVVDHPRPCTSLERSTCVPVAYLSYVFLSRQISQIEYSSR